MRLDYWNDPLVVSAYRIRFRGGVPAFMAATYFLALVALGGVLHYYLAEETKYSWLQIYCVVLVSIETVVAGVAAMMGTHQSMHAEVTTRTLDYQRIAAVAPREILLGKLIGEPVQGYLMVLAGLPLLVWCWGMGAVTWNVLAMLLVQIVTTAFLFGSIGLIYPLDTNSDKTKGAGRMVRIVVLVLIVIYAAPLTIMAPFMTTNPLTQLPVGFITPIFGIAGLARGTSGVDALPLFNWTLPYLYLTPVTQVLIGAIVLHSLTRRMISPVNVALDKLTTYAILTVVDVIAAGALCDPRTRLYTLEMTVGAFCLLHVIASLWLTFAITPGRECLRSWVWRFRGRTPLARDLLVGERSENFAALLAFCALGVAAAVLLVIAPYGARSAPAADYPVLVGAQFDKLATMCLLVLSLGTLYQFLVSIGQAMPMFFMAALATIIVGPHLAGAYLQMPELMATSPSAQFGHWILEEPSTLPWWPFLLAYGAMFGVARVMLSRRLKQTVRVVEKNIAAMLATGAKSPAS